MKASAWLTAGLLSIASAAAAQAQQAPPAAQAQPAPQAERPPVLQITKVFAKTGQALAYDHERGEYVLLRRGAYVGRFTVTAVYSNQVIVSSDSRDYVFMPSMQETTVATAPSPAATAEAAPTVTTAPIVPAAPAMPVAPTAPAMPDVTTDQPSIAEAAPTSPVTGAPPVQPQDSDEDASSALQPSPLAQPQNPYTAFEPAVPPPSDPSTFNPGYQSQPPLPSTPNEVPAAPGYDDYSDDEYAAEDPYGAAPADAYAAPPTNVPAAVPGQVATAASGRMRISRSELERTLSDFHALRRDARIESGSPSGFRLAQLSANSYFARIGLRQGDVISKIAGVEVRTAEDGAQVYAALMSTNYFDIELIRGGQRMTLSYELI